MHVRFAPKADKRAEVSVSPLSAKADFVHRSKMALLFYYLVAKQLIELGTSMPSALAVGRLMTTARPASRHALHP
jgi:hypothetical protein